MDASKQPKISSLINFTSEEYQRVNDAEARRLYLYGGIVPVDDFDGITYSSVSGIIEQILRINREDKAARASKVKRKPIVLYINSPGGDVFEGFALVDTILASETPIYTVNMGMWASMAFYIGIAGHKRFTLPNAIFLMHQGSFVSYGQTSQVFDQVDFQRNYERKVIMPHVLGHSNMTQKQYTEHAKREFYMLPAEARKWNFVDKIIKNINEVL